MITFEEMSATYPRASEPVLRDISLEIPAGNLCLVIGPTGGGKTTFLRSINGLFPRFCGGTLKGRVRVAGKSTKDYPPRELAQTVGVVGQDPLAGFVTDTVEEELAFCMEQLAIPPAVMRQRVESVVDLLGLSGLRNRALSELSGGQQQRVAIGSVLTAHPQVLVLDEPTSALDPTSAEEVLATVSRLVHDLGVTVVMSEHRMERVVQYADSMVLIAGDGTAIHGEPAEIMAKAELVPPVLGLGKLMGWNPLPLSIRDARRKVMADPPVFRTMSEESVTSPPGDELLTAKDMTVRYPGAVVAVKRVDVSVRAGEICALLGRNGAGKTSLLWAMQGAGRLDHGKVLVKGQNVRDLKPNQRRQLIGLVPQVPTDLLYLDSARAECKQADLDAGAPAGSCESILTELVPGIDFSSHPRDLSEGQRLALVLAILLTSRPAVLMLDEPTRGLDYRAKDQLAAMLGKLRDAGTGVLLSTHDIEFVAICCDRAIMLADGEVIADAPTAEVICATPGFAPQITRILDQPAMMTVADVAARLEPTRPDSSSEQIASQIRPGQVPAGQSQPVSIAQVQ